MQHQRDAAGGEVAAFAGNLFGEFLGHFAVDIGEIDAGLLEDAAFGQDARPSAAAALALPGVFAEAAAVDAFQGGDDAILQIAEVGGGPLAEGFGRHG